MDLARFLSCKQFVTRILPPFMRHTSLVLKMIVKFFQTADVGGHVFPAASGLTIQILNDRNEAPQLRHFLQQP